MGIVFGVASVIAMLAIGEGASYEAQQQIKNLGSQNIILTSEKSAFQKPPISHFRIPGNSSKQGGIDR